MWQFGLTIMCTNIYQKLIIGPIKKILQSKAVEQQTLQSTYIQQRIPPFKTIPSMCIVAHIIIKSRQSLARWVIAFFIPQRINRIAIGKLKMHHSWLDSFIQNFQGGFVLTFRLTTRTRRHSVRIVGHHKYGNMAAPRRTQLPLAFAFSFHCWGFAVDMENESIPTTHQGGRGMGSS